MNFKKISILIAASLISWCAFAQKTSVEVTVNDNLGPLPGVSVVVKGTTSGTITDNDGIARMDVAPDATLVISSIGYKTIEEAVAGRTKLTLTLESEAVNLDESVVVGYGTQKKENLTGAVAAVGAEAFDNRIVPNAARALEGAVSNLNISFSDGKEGRGASVNIRGTTSIGQGGSALVLIDGVEGDISTLNPADIESVSVLKDAASAAIYGARGTFGVVLITTKNADKGSASVTYTGSVSFKQPTMTPHQVTDGLVWLQNFRDAFYGRDGVEPSKINASQAYSSQYLADYYARREAGITAPVEIGPDGRYTYYGSTDWYKLLYKDVTTAQEHNIVVKGSTDRSSYYVSGRFYGFDGLYNYNPDTYKTFNIRAKASFKITNWLKVSNNMEFARSLTHAPNAARTNRTPVDFIELCAFPSCVPFNPDGTYTHAGAFTVGAMLDNRNYKDYQSTHMRNTVSAVASFFQDRLKIVGDFTVKYTHAFTVHKTYWTPYCDVEGVEAIQEPTQNSYAERNNRTLYTATNVYAQYEDKFAGKHYFKAMVGYNYETSKNYNQLSSRGDLLLPDAESIQLALSDETFGISATASNWRIMGLFARLNYSYDDRYLIEFNGRYDGSSKFPTNQQYAFFPSVSAGWRISQEPWFKISKKAWSGLKIRASYGSLGNGNIGAYKFLELMSISKAGRVLGGTNPGKVSSPAVVPESLTWETATTFDVGLDASWLSGRLALEADFYIRKTKDMFTVGPTLPAIFGATEPKGNYADMTTRGWELSLSWNDKVRLGNHDFRYGIKASVYDYRSVIDKYFNETGLYSDYYPGKVVGEIWGLKTDGLFKEDPLPSEYVCTIVKSTASGVWKAGDIKFVDLDGDGKITYGDKTLSKPGDFSVIGNSQPRYQYSIGLDFSYAGVFLNLFFNGVGHQDWYPGAESYFWGQYDREYSSLPEWHLTNRWTPETPDAYLPRYARQNTSLKTYANDRYLQNIGFIRLKSAQLGYNLPAKLTRKAKIENVKFFFSGENLWSWSPMYKYTKNSLEVFNANKTGDADSGAEFGVGSGYPLLRSFTLGASITF